ncbi:MAG: DNA gyrase subunit B, partial [uncultured Gemmatimonadetes bacterium]
PQERPVPQDHHHDGRGRGRLPHPHPAADLLLPPDAAADRRGLHLHRPAAALPGEEGEAGAVRLQRRRARRDHRPLQGRRRGGQGRARAALQGPRRDEPRAALEDHDGPRHAHPPQGGDGGRRAGRLGLHPPDGRRGGAAPAVHRRERALREEPGRL